MKVKFLMIAFALVFAGIAQAQPGGGGRGGDPAQRAEMQTKTMVDSLSLSSKQAEKVKEINLKYANKQNEARSANTDGDWEKMRTTMEAIRNEQNAELKTVMTQEQYDRWQKIAAEQWKKRGGPGGPDGKREKGRKEKEGTPPIPPPPPPAPEKEGGSGQ